jgi:cell division protein FtsQ
MAETVTVRPGNFLRPKQRELNRGMEGFQRILKKAMVVAFQLLLVAFFLFIGHQAYGYLRETPFFRVREVEVKGNQKIPKEILLSLTRVERMPNLFMVRLKEISRRLESHPWVDQVKVRKIFPSKILIEVEERKPIAIIQLEELYYIDAKGVIFSPVGDRDDHNYPFLTGLTRQLLEADPEGAKGLVLKALELLQLAGKEKISPLEAISEIHMERTFGIQFFTQVEMVEVRMGWDQFGDKLRKLSVVWSDLRRRGLSASSIDCSDPKRMVVARRSVQKKKFERR